MDDASTLCGLIRLAGLCAAIPVAAIREVVPCPERLEPLPASRPDLLGALELRGEVIPVIDLAPVMNPAQARTDPSPGLIVVILRHEDRVFGVLAHSIVGVMNLAASAMGRIDVTLPAAVPPLVAHSFTVADPAGGRINGIVLQPAAIAALQGMSLARSQQARAATDVGRVDEAALIGPMLICTVAGLRLALPASCVDASLPWLDLPPAPVPDRLWIAMRDYKQGQIPAVDTLALLDHGAMPGGRRGGASIVVRTSCPPGRADQARKFGLVALLIDTVDDIGRFAASAFSPLVQAGVPGAALARGTLQTRAGPALVLDATSLASHTDLMTLGMMENRADDADPVRRTGSAAGPVTGPAPVSGSNPDEHETGSVRPYLVFSTGGCRYSTPLDAVEEILVNDRALVQLPAGGKGVVGLFSSRGHSVPLIDLAQSLGQPAADSPRYVVVTRSKHGATVQRAGFQVEALHSVERKALQHVGRARKDGTRPGGLPEPTIRLGDGKASPVLDLAALATSLLAAA